MATVTIALPLSNFSRKIIQAEYGSTPVQPGRATWLSDMLRIDRSDTNFHDRTLAILATTLDIEVPAQLADRVMAQALRIGMVIHRQHVETLTRHMLSAANCGAPAKTAMQAFFDSYGIDDDDLNQETVYREYGRFKKKFFQNKPAKNETKSAEHVRRESRIWQGLDAQKNRPTNMELDALCNILDERLDKCRLRRTLRIKFQAHMYIYATIGGRSAVETGKKFKRYKGNVWKAIRSVRMRIRNDRRFAAAILPVLDGSAVLPATLPPVNLCIDSPDVPQANAASDTISPSRE